MRRVGAIVAAALIMGPATAQNPSRASGDWSISSVPDKILTDETNYFVGTPDLGNKAVMALQCSHGIAQYFFAVLAAAFQTTPAGATGATLYFHVDDNQEAALSTTSLGNGMVAVFDDEHSPSFKLLLRPMLQGGATAVIVSATQEISPPPWVFSLRGFAESYRLLTQRCGFTPTNEQERWKHQR